MQQATTTKPIAHAARKTFAGRHTVSYAVFDADGNLKEPRHRARRPLGTSFRAWARKTFAARPPSELSPKLRQIVHGKETP